MQKKRRKRKRKKKRGEKGRRKKKKKGDIYPYVCFIKISNYKLAVLCTI